MQHNVTEPYSDSKKKLVRTGFTLAAALVLVPVFLANLKGEKRMLPASQKPKKFQKPKSDQTPKSVQRPERVQRLEKEVFSWLDIDVKNVRLFMDRRRVESLLGEPDLVYEKESLILYDQDQQILSGDLVLSQMGYGFNAEDCLVEVTAVAGFPDPDSADYTKIYRDLSQTLSANYGDPCDTYEFWWDESRDGYFADSGLKVDDTVKNQAISMGNLIIGAEWNRDNHKCIITIDHEGLTVIQSLIE